MISTEFSEELFLCGVKFEVVVIKCDFIKDKIFTFGDFQEASYVNESIFEYCINILSDNGYNIKEFTSISCGDMYGESSQFIKVRGCDGIPEYPLYLNTDKLFYVYGNHDIQLNKEYDNIIPLDDIKVLEEGTTIMGFHGIQSSKNKYPSQYPNYNSNVKLTLNKLKRNGNNVDIIVTHETPLIDNFDMNTRRIGNKDLEIEINRYKPKVHIFGHCHFKKSHCVHNDILYINADSRFILLIPE